MSSEVLQLWVAIAAIAAGVGAVASGAAAIVALVLSKRQAAVFHNDYINRSLVDLKNSLNLSRYYRQSFKQWIEELQLSLDQISVVKTSLEDNRERLVSGFDAISAPNPNVKDYHLINYKPSSAYSIMTSYSKIQQLSEMLENYKKAFPKMISERTSDEEILDMCDTIEAEMTEIVKIVRGGLSELNAEISATERVVSELETRKNLH